MHPTEEQLSTPKPNFILEAQAHQRAGRLQEAEDTWRRILAEQPGLPAGSLGLVTVLESTGRRVEAEAALRDFVASGPTPAGLQAAARVWEGWESTPPPGAKTVRIALIGTATLNTLGAHLRVACGQIGLHPSLHVGEFNQWAQELLSPQSPLYAFAPELIIVLVDPAALLPETLSAVSATEEEAGAERRAAITQMREALSAAERIAPSAAVLLHTFALPDYAPLGILDIKREEGQRTRLGAVNSALLGLVREEFPRTLLFDQERIESRHGKSRIRDERLWYMASLPFSDSFLPVMAGEYLRYIRPLKGLTRKCLVLDLDNTLWGGVVGEDGLEGIKIGGTSAPGNAFADFQHALLTLSQRGILLALCSKNNSEDVWPIFDTHPDMALRRKDFAASRINWQDKASNIREIAHELNLGLDSFVFLDDNPVERGLVRQSCPEVMTPEMPRDPAQYTRLLRSLDVFETLSLTEEDLRRGELYREQQSRREFEAGAKPAVDAPGDLTAYLAGLEMQVTLAPATPFTLPRIAQLLNKTNQFNMTTRRLTEAQVQARASAPEEWGIYAVSVADRFGDSGLTGAAIVKKSSNVWEIDSFLLSCRVLSRGVEDALLVYLLNQARNAGVFHLRGLFLATAKNSPASGFYARQGFEQVGEDESTWELRLDAPEAAKDFPDWLQIKQ